jgi:pantoate--beta-alanine ligase
MQVISDRLRNEGKRIGFVPTMGYLHEGHLSLIRKAQEFCNAVVVSIFGNSIQFVPGEDFQKYPRDEVGDRAKLEAESVNFLFIPEGDKMYPVGYQTHVEVTEVSQGLCGDFKLRHFKGVSMVVAKLFNIVKPHVAIFGEKDYQQLLLNRKMV